MPRPRNRNDLPTLVARLSQRDRGALARLLTFAASRTQHSELIAALASATTHASPVIAMTGSGGVGKSSLVGCLSNHFASRGEAVGVLACDPQSPVTGGALLGDRCRIVNSEFADRVFVRSLSTASGHQGVAQNLALMLLAMQVYGFDRIFVETVGIGQGDIAVRDLADIVVLVIQPQTGDELQWEKAGILEVVDLVVVNKSDLAGADQTIRDVKQQLHSPPLRAIPVISTSIAKREGIETLCLEIDQVLRKSAKKEMSDAESSGQSDVLVGRKMQSIEPSAVIASSDLVLDQIADYVCASANFSDEAWATARVCLLDSLGCGLLSLRYPQCTKLLGPVVPGATLQNGARVPGTSYVLDPVTAAFNLGCMIRWLDYNDTWLAAEWGHPSDNFGGILAVADYLSRQDQALAMRDVLVAAIKAYEIQGVLALQHAFNRVGLDHVILVRIATTAVVTRMLGGTRRQVINALSNAWLDGGALRTYRHAPNTGTRKSWAAGDATRRGVQLALWSMAGEMGYPTALSAPRWGFEDVVLAGETLSIPRPLGCYVIENILFKVAFPAEFHAQTAAEAAIQLHDQVAGRWDAIERIRIETQESAMRIINKTGPLSNAADRDHCLQYIVAVALRKGRLDSDHYEQATADDPAIDAMRDRMEVVEKPRYSTDYLDPDKRSIANAVQVYFSDGTATERIEVEYPLGHRRRRAEALPKLRDKFRVNVGSRFAPGRVSSLEQFFDAGDDFNDMPVRNFMNEFAQT